MKTQNLTLKEAVESGRPFRAMGNDKWYTIEQVMDWKVQVADALSRHWEIKAKETFTRADIERALEIAMHMAGLGTFGKTYIVAEAMKAAESDEGGV